MTVSPHGSVSLHALLGLPADASPATINSAYARAATRAVADADPLRAIALSQALAALPLAERRVVFAAGRPDVPSAPPSPKSGLATGLPAPALVPTRRGDHGFASTASTVCTAAAAATAAVVVANGWGGMLADQFTALAGQLHHLLAR